MEQKVWPYHKFREKYSSEINEIVKFNTAKQYYVWIPNEHLWKKVSNILVHYHDRVARALASNVSRELVI